MHVLVPSNRTPIAMRSAVFITALAVVHVSNLASAQRDCGYPTTNDITVLIRNTLSSGDAFSLPAVNISSFQPLCLAYSRLQYRYRGLSVLVRYTCTDSSVCPLGGGELVEQFESACENGVWSNRILGSTADTRTRAPTASFETVLREDCAYCLSPELALSVGVPATPNRQHHCVGETASYCSNVLQIARLF